MNDLHDILRYNDWANDRMAGAVRQLSDEQCRQPITSSFNSVRETVGHIASAEWIWLSRWLGESPTAFPDWLKTDSTERFLERIVDVRKQRLAWFAGLAEADLARFLDYRLLSGKEMRNTIPDMIRHVVNHSTYHRGQLTTQFRQLGHPAPATDFILYARDRA